MSATHQPKSFAIVGIRLGTLIHTDNGFIVNGQIRDVEQQEYLRAAGYTLTECAGPPSFDPAAVHWTEIQRRDRVLRDS